MSDPLGWENVGFGIILSFFFFFGLRERATMYGIPAVERSN